MKKLKSLLVSLVLALACISMVTSTDVVEASSIKLNKTSLTIYTGKTSTLKVSGTSKKVTWSTSNKKVATVSSKGTVSAKSSGTATITAKVNNKNLRCKVTVKKPTINKTSTSLSVGQTTTLKLTGATLKSAKSSNTSIATVNSSGKITAKKAGTCTITLTDTQKRTYKCTVTVKSSSSSKKAALKAYYNFLKSYKFDLDSSSRGFDLAYINNDSIPELIVFDGDYHAAGGKVYAYVNGKVKYVGEFGEWGGFQYQEKKGVICSTWSRANSYTTYYKWSGSKLSTIMSSSAIGEFSSNGDFEYKYYINDKEVTLSKYNSSIAPYVKGLKSVSLSNSYAVTDSVMKDKLLK